MDIFDWRNENKVIGFVVCCVFLIGCVIIWWQRINRSRPDGNCWRKKVTQYNDNSAVSGSVVLPSNISLSLLKSFGPKVGLVASNDVVPLGTSINLSWIISGPIERLKNLRLTLKAAEVCWFQVSNDNAYDSVGSSRSRKVTRLIHDKELYYSNDSSIASAGEVCVDFPENSMHSFNCSQGTVRWYFEVKGEVDGAPDIKQSHEINVLPALRRIQA